MKAPISFGVGLLLFPTLVLGSGALAPITLTESVNRVMLVDATGANGETTGTEGASIPGGRFVRTEAGGRAELSFGGDRALRLGVDTEVELNLLGDTVTLRRGSALLSGFTGAQRLIVEHAGKTVIITGDTAFVELAERADGPGRVLVIGAMAGRATVRGLGKAETIKPGELCALDESGAVTRGQFNLAKQVATSALVNDFRFPLLGMERVRQAVKGFTALESRGFVRSPDASGTMVASRKLNRTGAELATLAIPHAAQGVQLTQTGGAAAATLSLGGLSVMNSISGQTRSTMTELPEAVRKQMGMNSISGQTRSTMGTMTISSGLTYVNNASFSFQLESAGLTSSLGASDLIISTGNLPLDAIVNVNGFANFNGRTYRLINYTGSLTDNGLNIGTLTGNSIGSNPGDLSIVVGTGTINLIVTQPPLPPTPLTPGQ
jgi:hypothetical protein